MPSIVFKRHEPQRSLKRQLDGRTDGYVFITVPPERGRKRKKERERERLLPIVGSNSHGLRGHCALSSMPPTANELVVGSPAQLKTGNLTRGNDGHIHTNTSKIINGCRQRRVLLKNHPVKRIHPVFYVHSSKTSIFRSLLDNLVGPDSSSSSSSLPG